MFERMKALFGHEERTRATTMSDDQERTMTGDSERRDEAPGTTDPTTASGDANLSPALQIRDRVIAVLKTVYDPEIPSTSTSWAWSTASR